MGSSLLTVLGYRHTNIVVYNTPQHFFLFRRPSHRASPWRALSTWSHSWKSYTHSFFNMMVSSHTAVTRRGHFLMKHFLTDCLAVVDQSPGLPVHLMSPPGIFFLLRMWRTVFGKHHWITLQTFVQGFWKQSEVWRQKFWSAHRQNWTAVFMWLAPVGVMCWDTLKHT